MRNPVQLTAVATCLILISAGTAVAGKKSAGQCRQPVASNCATTNLQWYKAQDGTYREMIPYWTALRRAEVADDLELKLKEAQDEVAQVRANAEAEKQDMLARLQEMEAKLAESTKRAESQSERAAQAEAAHKQSIEQVANLRDRQKRLTGQLDEARKELDAANQELASAQEQVNALTQQNDELKQAAEAAKATPVEEDGEPEREKQAALESRKPVISDEPEEGSDEGSSAGAE